MNAPKLTDREWTAVRAALNASMASGVLDGYDEGSREEREEFAARHRALAKIKQAQDT